MNCSTETKPRIDWTYWRRELLKGTALIVIGAVIASATRGCTAARPIGIDSARVTPQGSTFDVTNPSTSPVRLTHMAFEISEESRHGGFGRVENAFVMEFRPQHYDAVNNRYIAEIHGWYLEPGEQGAILIRIVDDRRAGQQVFGRLVVYYGDRNAPRSTVFAETSVHCLAEN